jgi:hypothetical protein
MISADFDGPMIDIDLSDVVCPVCDQADQLFPIGNLGIKWCGRGCAAMLAPFLKAKAAAAVKKNRRVA